MLSRYGMEIGKTNKLVNIVHAKITCYLNHHRIQPEVINHHVWLY